MSANKLHDKFGVLKTRFFEFCSGYPLSWILTLLTFLNLYSTWLSPNPRLGWQHSTLLWVAPTLLVVIYEKLKRDAKARAKCDGSAANWYTELKDDFHWVCDRNPLTWIAIGLLSYKLWENRPGQTRQTGWLYLIDFSLLAVILAVLFQKLKKNAESLSDITETVHKVTELKREIDRVRSEMELSRRISEQLRYSVKQKSALLELIDESVREDQLFVLAGISPASYLRKLQKAVKGTVKGDGKYITIQRYGPKWFKENAGTNLLLKEQNKQKLDTYRIFVGTSKSSPGSSTVSPDATSASAPHVKERETAEQIKEQLENPEDSQWYWQEIDAVDSKTHTYVADEEKLAHLCGIHASEIYDVVIVDDLVFEYREDFETLRFTTLSPQIKDGSALMKICSMLEAFGDNPLTEVCPEVNRPEGIEGQEETASGSQPPTDDVAAAVTKT